MLAAGVKMWCPRLQPSAIAIPLTKGRPGPDDAIILESDFLINPREKEHETTI